MIVISGIALAEVAAVLPKDLADRLEWLKTDEIMSVEELRLRRGYPMNILLPDGECPVGGRQVTESDLRKVLELASRASAHTVLEQAKSGFVTLRGGHRIGICGTVNRHDGKVVSLRYLSSLSIRVAREMEGQAADLIPQITEKGVFLSTLILGAPGSGKTTLLRELIRTLSDGHGTKAHRIGVADERGEVAALWQGEAQFRIGRRTDVLDGCPKAEGLSILLRAMNPEILAMDEITHPDDVAAIVEAAGCGAALLATAHGGSTDDLVRRPVYRALMNEHIFQRVIVLERDGSKRSAHVEVLA